VVKLKKIKIIFKNETEIDCFLVMFTSNLVTIVYYDTCLIRDILYHARV
jgi:hypothetical protein